MPWRGTGWVEVQLNTFLTSALDGDEWSTSGPGSFTPGERLQSTHRRGIWVGPRTIHYLPSTCTFFAKSNEQFLYKLRNITKYLLYPGFRRFWKQCGCYVFQLDSDRYFQNLPFPTFNVIFISIVSIVFKELHTFWMILIRLITCECIVLLYSRSMCCL